MRDNTVSFNPYNGSTRANPDHYLVIKTFFEERGVPEDGFVGRIAREQLESLGKLGRYEEDLLVGIALIKAIAHWRALATLWEFDSHLHQMQMKHELERVAKFLSQKYRTKFFISERPKRSRKQYVEILSPHSQIEYQ